MLIQELINSEIWKMSNVIRYSWTKIHNQENLAEHSYYVILISDIIRKDLLNKYKWLKIDWYKVLKYALYHDIEEAFTWDIITPVKHKSKTLLKELEKIGKKLLNEWLSESFKQNLHIKENILEFFNEYEIDKYTKIENQIVKFSDQLEAFIYSISELKMWNSNFDKIAKDIVIWIKNKWSKNHYFKDYVEELENFFYDFNKSQNKK